MPMQEGIKRAKTPLYALLLPVCLPGWHYGIIAAKQLLYRDYGQDAAQAKPAPVPMADYIKAMAETLHRQSPLPSGCPVKPEKRPEALEGRSDRVDVGGGAVVLFIILVSIAVFSVILLAYRRDHYALLIFGMGASLILLLVGIIIYTAKTGGMSEAQKVFLYFSSGIQKRLSYLIFPLSRLGYLIAIGRYLFPLFLLLVALNYSMIPLVRRCRKWWALICFFPIVSLLLYYPRVFYTIVRNRFVLQRFLMTAMVLWIVLYLLAAGVLLLHEYASVTIAYYRRQFRTIVILIASMMLLYLMFGLQDPIQVYQLYTTEYMWFNGMSYANPDIPLWMWQGMSVLIAFSLVLGFWNLREYSQITVRENDRAVSLERKFDTASMGVSVFVHSIKNQLLAARVAYKKLEQELAKPEQDEKKLEEYLHLLETMNDTMLQRMEELYRSVKSSYISLTPTSAEEIVRLAAQRFAQKYPEVSLEVLPVPQVLLLADSTHLTEALYNLLTNGYEATVASGRPDRKVALAVHDERLWVVFEVRDNGCGMTRQEQKKIYDPFYTNKNTNFNWGMGLYYVCQIVKSHLGALRVESVKNEGTSFFMQLPRYTPRVDTALQRRQSK